MRGEYTLRSGSIDGAVMNNVLYSIPDDQRIQVLKGIFASLKSGAHLVLNDPRALHQQDDSALGNFSCLCGKLGRDQPCAND